MITVSVTILTMMGRSICTANSYCDNMTITRSSISSANRYCDNNGGVYVRF